MQTEFYESDPFTPRKTALLLTIESDYRFEKGDEVTIETAGRPLKVRVMDIRVHVKDGLMSREILALKV
jgi:hypothetical protein